jgi:hypothetical protein
MFLLLLYGTKALKKSGLKEIILSFPASALILFGLFYLLPASLFTPHLIPQLEYTGKSYGINPFIFWCINEVLTSELPSQKLRGQIQTPRQRESVRNTESCGI